MPHANRGPANHEAEAVKPIESHGVLSATGGHGGYIAFRGLCLN
jgi:hypothetical protein